MSSARATAGTESRLGAALVALIPAAVGAAVVYSLRKADAEEFSDVARDVAAAAAAAGATLLTGAPIFKRAIRKDEQRSLHNAKAPEPGKWPDHATPEKDPSMVVNPGATTVALSVVLAAAAFWLIDLATSMFGWGSLGFLGEAVPADPRAQFRAASIRSLPLQLAGVFLVAVWIAHRLRDEAGQAVTKAVVFYVSAALATNVLFGHLGERGLVPEDVIIPLLGGIASWAASSVGTRYARRTQQRFDFARAALLQARFVGGHE